MLTWDYPSRIDDQPKIGLMLAYHYQITIDCLTNIDQM